MKRIPTSGRCLNKEKQASKCKHGKEAIYRHREKGPALQHELLILISDGGCREVTKLDHSVSRHPWFVPAPSRVSPHFAILSNRRSPHNVGQRAATRTPSVDYLVHGSTLNQLHVPVVLTQIVHSYTLPHTNLTWLVGFHDGMGGNPGSPPSGFGPPSQKSTLRSAGLVRPKNMGAAPDRVPLSTSISPSAVHS
jgi:hypothetical protein